MKLKYTLPVLCLVLGLTPAAFAGSKVLGLIRGEKGYAESFHFESMNDRRILLAEFPAFFDLGTPLKAKDVLSIGLKTNQDIIHANAKFRGTEITKLYSRQHPSGINEEIDFILNNNNGTQEILRKQIKFLDGNTYVLQKGYLKKRNFSISSLEPNGTLLLFDMKLPDTVPGVILNIKNIKPTANKTLQFSLDVENNGTLSRVDVVLSTDNTLADDQFNKILSLKVTPLPPQKLAQYKFVPEISRTEASSANTPAVVKRTQAAQ